MVFMVITCSSRTRGDGFKLKEGRFNYVLGTNSSLCGGEALAQAAQSSCGCPIPGSAPGQAGWGWEQPGLGGSLPGAGGLELHGL